MFSNVRFGCLLLVCLSCSAVVSAQHATPRTQAGTGRIYLNVVVTSKTESHVAGLQRQDFTLLDNKTPQTITSFEAVSARDAPIEVVLVVDAVNITAQVLDYERLQLGKFLRADRGNLAYPVALEILTDDGFQLVADFSSDGNALSASLEKKNVGRRDIGPAGHFWGATDRLRISLDALSQLVTSLYSRPGRKLILWVSPGWPLLSGPEVTMDLRLEQQVFGNIVGLSTNLLWGRITLYSIDPLGTSEYAMHASDYERFLKGISKPSQAQLGNVALQVTAIQSGGLALIAGNDIAKSLQECVNDSAPYYEISFDPPPPAGPNDYHHLEIHLAKPGLTARTRQLYYAQPAAPTHN